MSFWGRFSILAGTVYRLGLRVNPELLAGGHSLLYRLILTPYQGVIISKEVINKGVLGYALPLDGRSDIKTTKCSGARVIYHTVYCGTHYNGYVL